MDPNALLRDLLDLADVIGTTDDDDEFADAADELAQKIQAMHAWLSRGGFLPAAWER